VPAGARLVVALGQASGRSTLGGVAIGGHTGTRRPCARTCRRVSCRRRGAAASGRQSGQRVQRAVFVLGTAIACGGPARGTSTPRARPMRTVGSIEALARSRELCTSGRRGPFVEPEVSLRASRCQRTVFEHVLSAAPAGSVGTERARGVDSRARGSRQRRRGASPDCTCRWRPRRRGRPAVIAGQAIGSTVASVTARSPVLRHRWCSFRGSRRRDGNRMAIHWSHRPGHRTARDEEIGPWPA
jgi:hypothetical protein